MSVYTKNNEGKVTKIAGMITQRLNTRWFLCARSLEDGIEYYTVPADAQSYFKNIDAFTIYSFGFNEPNTTLSPKLRYGNTVLDIRDFTNEGGSLVAGQLSGVYQMFTQDLNNDPKIYFVGTTHPDAIDAEVSTTSTNAVQNQAITKYANDLLSKASKVEIDNTTITKNTQEQIQAVGVMDETNNVNKVHSALTKEQFNALTEYDENTYYPVTDETGVDSIGGASGTIALGDGLSISNNVLSASGGGSKLYQHLIKFANIEELLLIKSTSNVTFTNETLAAYLYNRGYNGGNRSIKLLNIENGKRNDIFIFAWVYSSDGTTLSSGHSGYKLTITDNNTIDSVGVGGGFITGSFTDTVTEL